MLLQSYKEEIKQFSSGSTDHDKFLLAFAGKQ